MRPAKQLRALMLVVALIACSPSPEAQPQNQAANADVSELWQEPVDLASRDLFLGPGGAALVPPSTDGKFQFVAFKTSGTNPGYDVKDAAGRLWSVKLGIEAQPEIAASRIIWAIGFPQPPQYFVHQFTLTGAGDSVIKNARFRTDIEHWKSVADWSWYDNPFVRTTPFHGLIVAQLILNNWDLKTINNRIYKAADATTLPRRQYMVRDLGASLGWSKQFALFNMLGTVGGQGSKNDIAGFEAQGFINSVDGNKVTFDYRGTNLALLKRVTVPDVIWTCELLARISDEQWQDAFRAGAYPQAEADRFIKKIKQKVAQGLALKAAAPLR
jgi:hypothetical protein